MTPTFKPRSHAAKAWLCCGMVLLLAGCASLSAQPPPGQTNLPTPTVAPFFRNSPTAVPGPPLGLPTEAQASATALASATRPPTMPAPTRTAEQIAAIALYDDALNQDWSPQRSEKVRYDLSSTAYVYSGESAIMVTPAADFGRLFLTVRKDARKIYPRDRILGVRFQLSGGENTITTSDLAVTVVGSNQYAYWVADDTSVKIDTPVTPENPLFSETRLYFLHINRSIPPNAWVEVVLWLDDLIHDPDYTYITGFYIKNDKGFLSTFYIDDIQLLVQRQAV